jgi:hypothetical protein
VNKRQQGDVDDMQQVGHRAAEPPVQKNLTSPNRSLTSSALVSLGDGPTRHLSPSYGTARAGGRKWVHRNHGRTGKCVGGSWVEGAWRVADNPAPV